MLPKERVITMLRSAASGDTSTMSDASAMGESGWPVTHQVGWPSRRTRSATAIASEVVPGA